MDSQSLNDKSWNAKSLLLSILSLLSVFFIILTLQVSWNSSQEQTKLDLLQTDLILQATQSVNQEQDHFAGDFLQSLISDGDPQDIYIQSLRSYQEVLQANKAALERLSQDMSGADSQSIPKQLQKKQDAISEISMRAGYMVKC
jgi:hypothetical protein